MNCSSGNIPLDLCELYDNFVAFKGSDLGNIIQYIFAGIAVLWSIWKGYLFIKSEMGKRRMSSQLQELEMNSLIRSFQENDILNAQKNYIIPYCSNIDPSNQDDLRTVVGVRESIFSALDNELNQTSDSRHILVLADSGMGKTTLLLNIFMREQRISTNKRKRIALVALGRSDALDQIKDITNHRDTILLLDAFDEDTEAIKNYKERMNEIMNAAADCKAVVMTCRTQFFSQESSIPKETGILRVHARRAGVSSTHAWKSIYLQPFDNSQVTEYIESVIPWTNFKHRKKAKRLVAQIPELAIRPMLLALIPELASSKKDAHNLWDLYVFMVDQWLARESKWIDRDELIRISMRLAVDLVLNRSERKTERIPLDDLMSLLGMNRESIESWKLTGRSLLNRDANGNYKFAHRSIMEFLFIRAFIEGNNDCASVQWTDMMCELFVSWGKQVDIANPRLKEILSIDLRATSLFPFMQLPVVASSMDASWVKKVFSDESSFGVRSGLPVYWRPQTSRITIEPEYARIYDFAYGLIFQVTRTNHMEREERELYRVNRFGNRWVDSDDKVWTLPQLSEFRNLVEIFAMHNKLYDLLDDREMYWLADTDNESFCLVRIRFREDSVNKADEYPYMNLIHTICQVIGEIQFSINVYGSSLKGKSTNLVEALPIFVNNDGAEKGWYDDLISGISEAGIMKQAQ